MAERKYAESGITSEPFKSAPSEDTLVWRLGDGPEAKLVVHAAGRRTGLACSIAEHIWQPGDAGGFHAHMLEDEAFYVIEGELTVHMPDDGVTLVAGPGELIWHPRGRRHDYAVTGDGPVRLLQILVPGTELIPGFFEAVAGDGAPDLTDPEEVARFFAWSRDTYGVEFRDGQSE